MIALVSRFIALNFSSPLRDFVTASDVPVLSTSPVISSAGARSFAFAPDKSRSLAFARDDSRHPGRYDRVSQWKGNEILMAQWARLTLPTLQYSNAPVFHYSITPMDSYSSNVLSAKSSSTFGFFVISPCSWEKSISVSSIFRLALTPYGYGSMPNISCVFVRYSLPKKSAVGMLSDNFALK